MTLQELLQMGWNVKLSSVSQSVANIRIIKTSTGTHNSRDVSAKDLDLRLNDHLQYGYNEILLAEQEQKERDKKLAAEKQVEIGEVQETGIGGF